MVHYNTPQYHPSTGIICDYFSQQVKEQKKNDQIFYTINLVKQLFVTELMSGTLTIEIYYLTYITFCAVCLTNDKNN